ncbi:MAG TPA: ABC transporter ATP-binding protein, partial [Longimicrobiales bacterium]|nr:ABC transporter ATP-binding protein [Longimicrobiales bacterium]
VAENLAFYADLYRVPRADRPARLERLYRFSRLDEFQDRLAGNLSGGMKQKLALSCALIPQPRLLLLDEPTFGVDPISRRDLWLIVHEMVEEGVTVIVSTSYLDEAERCDRVALLSEGRMLALDTPVRLVGRAPGRIVEIRTTHPRGDRDRIRSVDGVAGALLFGERIHVTLRDGASWDEVAARLDGTGVEVLEARAAEASLEDVFLALVGREVAA